MKTNADWDKFFNAQKGFGFIKQTDGGPVVFVHLSDLALGMPLPDENMKVSFDLAKDQRSATSERDQRQQR